MGKHKKYVYGRVAMGDGRKFSKMQKESTENTWKEHERGNDAHRSLETERT